MSEENILSKIDSYLKEHWERLKERLGNDGEVFVAMYSAEKFANIATSTLDIPEERIIREPVSSYGANMQSSWDDIPEELKTKLRDTMNLKDWVKVLIVEDMIDTGNTLMRLVRFFESEGAVVEILALFNKPSTDVSAKARETLWDKLKTIIDIEDNFIIGFGIDWLERLFADIEWLYQVKPGMEAKFIIKSRLEYLNPLSFLKQSRSR